MNVKKTYLGKDPHGRDRYALDLYSKDPTLNLQVGQSSDDCARMLATDYWLLAGAILWAGAYNSCYYKYGSGMRFTNVTIPKGSTIDTAYLTFRARSKKTTNPCNTRISAEDVDNAPTFADDKDAFDSRYANHTSAVVDWDNIPGWEAGNDYNSPEIKTVIQEIVNREGWASGNAMVIFWEDFDDRSSHSTTDCMRQGRSYDDDSNYAPKLHIEYTLQVAGRSFGYVIP